MDLEDFTHDHDDHDDQEEVKVNDDCNIGAYTSEMNPATSTTVETTAKNDAATPSYGSPQSILKGSIRTHRRPRPPHHRIVLLFDLDCFYAQCERVRLGLQRSAPICLLQWDSCLAVSYPAREFGIKRGDSWDDVAKKSNNTCWSIHLPVIPLIQSTTASTSTSPDEKKEKDENDSNDTDVTEEEANGVRSSNVADEFDRVFKLTPEQQKHCRETERGVRRHQRDGKACLERYRLASARIFGVVLESLTSHIKGSDKQDQATATATKASSSSSSSSSTSSFILEKASIDEFYLDITDYCYSTTNDKPGRPHDVDSDDDSRGNGEKFDPVTTEKKTVMIGQQADDERNQQSTLATKDYHNSSNETDFTIIQQALLRGCYIASLVRSDVWKELGFTMSAGISTNKTMSKLAASYGKPNGQAMLHPTYFAVVLGETKMKKVRNFGGALGNSVLSMLSKLRHEEGDTEPTDIMMHDVTQVPLPSLMNFFSPETAEHIFLAAQGIDNEAVKETSGALVKSITAFKSFPAMNSITDIRNWLVVLSKEIAERVSQDTARNNRYPKTCTLNYSYYTTATANRPSEGTSRRRMRQSRSVRLNFPSDRESIDRKSTSLVQQSMQKVEEILKQHIKLCGIGLAAANFEARGPPQGMSSIQSFFQKTDGDSRSSSSPQAQSVTMSSTIQHNAKSDPEDREYSSRAKEEQDLEIARRLQAQYDRENYVMSRSERNMHKRQQGVKNSQITKKKKVPKIDSFFTKKK